MISTQNVVEIASKVRQEPGRDELLLLLEAAADGLQETDFKRMPTYNRLARIVSDIIDRLVAGDPAAGLKDLMQHSYPEVFSMSTLKYYRQVDEHAAVAMATAIADANPSPSPLGAQARQILADFEFHRKIGNTPSQRAANEAEPFVPPQVTPVFRPIDRPQLEAIAVEAGCEILRPVLHAIAWPSLRLRRTRVEGDALPVGASKLGGCPDMPPMEEWPRFRSNPLSFIGQVNLSDIARYRTFTHFPPEGLLLFFYDADTQPRASEELEPGSAQVLYLAAGLPLLRRVAPEDLYEELQYPPASIEFIEDMTLPGMDAAFDSEAPDAGPPDLSDEQFEAFERLMDAVEDYRQEDNQPMHRMFGFPDGWQDAMYLSGDYLGATDGTPEDCYRMLLQVDSDEGWNEESPEGMFWGSGGRIHFWINRSDLLRGRFGDVELILQCT